MVFKLMKLNYEVVWYSVQAEITRAQRNFVGGLGIFIILLSGQQVLMAQGIGSGSSTSPLEILESAPKVRFDEPTPKPRPVEPVPYTAPRQAPPVQPIAPAFTPYAGTRTNSQPQYGQYAPGYVPARATPTLTPRPVLGPEDVKKKEKKGFMGSLFRAFR